MADLETIIRDFSPRCPVENVSTMRRVDSGPAGARWKCDQCGVVVVMPRVALRRALRLVSNADGIARAVRQRRREERTADEREESTRTAEPPTPYARPIDDDHGLGFGGYPGSGLSEYEPS